MGVEHLARVLQDSPQCQRVVHARVEIALHARVVLAVRCCQSLVQGYDCSHERALREGLVAALCIIAGMTTSFGVSMDEDMADALEAPLEYGDDRSERVRELVGDGLAIEDTLDELGMEFDSARDRRAWIRQAMLEQHRAEGARG